jgi:hypothetical protein
MAKKEQEGSFKQKMELQEKMSDVLHAELLLPHSANDMVRPHVIKHTEDKEESYPFGISQV